MTDPSKILDGLLVLQYRSGKTKALNLLVRKYHNKLCKHSYWYTHDIDVAKDIVQDCWSVIINKLDSLKDPNLFGSWAFRIVTRKSLDYVSKRKRDQSKLQEYSITAVARDGEEDNKVEVEKLLKGILVLPKDQQVVIRLFYTENYTLIEIGSILEISVGTVKSRLFSMQEKN